MLQDFFHNPSILNFHPTQIAVSCLFVALQVYGLKVPHFDETDLKAEQWFNVRIFCLNFWWFSNLSDFLVLGFREGSDNREDLGDSGANFKSLRNRREWLISNKK